jgi:integration host factor subunit beta
MMKSELIDILAREQSHLAYKDVELAVRCILEQMSAALASGERIEIRGFGSFSLHFRPPRVGRNPKTGDAVALSGKHVPHFKPGKELRDRVNEAYQAELARVAQTGAPSSTHSNGGSQQDVPQDDDDEATARSRAAAGIS